MFPLKDNIPTDRFPVVTVALIVANVIVYFLLQDAVLGLPDGGESVQLVPRGKYCFGDLPPCTVAWRQFVLRLRGAPAGPYRILIEGICFELCLHRMTEECVTFDVCKD